MPSYSRILAVACGALLVGNAASLYAAPGGKPHLAESDCAGCHLAGKSVDPAQASRLVGPQEKQCGACHEAAIKVSHPSGFAPKGKPPDDYPLDWKGDLTCSTCHQPHGNAPGLLRGAKRGKDLCLACHDAAFFKGMKDHGSSIVESGHLRDRAGMAGVELDPYSLQCMRCHGSYSNVIVGRNGVVRHDACSVNHPIGGRYRDSARRDGYRPESVLTKSILLPDGKLSCVSCHQGYKREHGKLVMSNERSNLCYQCHDL